MRKALNAIYETHQKKLIDFANKQINELMDDDPVTPEAFAAHATGFLQQNFVDTEFIYESGVCPSGHLVYWGNSKNAPHEVARNHLLVALYKVFISCMKSDSESESARLLTLREVLDAMSLGD